MALNEPFASKVRLPIQRVDFDFMGKCCNQALLISSGIAYLYHGCAASHPQLLPPLEHPNDKWVRWPGIPLLVLLANLIYLEEYHYDPRRYFGWSLFGMVYVALVWNVIVWWLMWVRRRFAKIQQTRRRILVTFVGYFISITLFQLAFVWLIDKTGVAPIPINRQVYVVYLVTGFVCTVLVGVVYEVIYYLRKYREAVQEAEALKKVGLQSQYDSLKNQVNPHFLFNALTSLSALITEDRQKAGLFLDELSSAYRYLLQAGQRPLVTLNDELSFLMSFRHLLNARFGDTLRWEIAIDDRFRERSLPPLTLQTLVENALRHNRLMTSQPLTLSIWTTEDGFLVVSNPIQRKKTAILNQQGGLLRLATHFEMLDMPRPIFDDNDREFVVRLPLAHRELTESYR